MLFFDTFLLLIILGRMIDLSVNCLFTSHREHCFLWMSIHKIFNLIDLCGCLVSLDFFVKVNPS